MTDMQSLTEKTVVEFCTPCNASKYENLKQGHPDPVAMTIFDAVKRIVASVMCVRKTEFSLQNKVSLTQCIIGLPNKNRNLIKEFAEQVAGGDMIIDVFCVCNKSVWYHWGKGRVSHVGEMCYTVDRVQPVVEQAAVEQPAVAKAAVAKAAVAKAAVAQTAVEQVAVEQAAVEQAAVEMQERDNGFEQRMNETQVAFEQRMNKTQVTFEQGMNETQVTFEQTMDKRQVAFAQRVGRETGHKRRRECADRESVAAEDDDSASSTEEDDGDADYVPVATPIKTGIDRLLKAHAQIPPRFKEQLLQLLNSYED